MLRVKQLLINNNNNYRYFLMNDKNVMYNLSLNYLQTVIIKLNDKK